MSVGCQKSFSKNDDCFIMPQRGGKIQDKDAMRLFLRRVEFLICLSGSPRLHLVGFVPSALLHPEKRAIFQAALESHGYLT